MHFSAKKLFLVGFFVLLLVGIPVSIYLIQQQQELRSRAEKSTNLTFTPDSSVSTPITKNVGDAITLNLSVDPGTNVVSYMKIQIQYDPDKIATASSDAFQANNTTFPTVEGPLYEPGKVTVTLSVGPDPTKAISNKVTAATFNFKAIGGTGADTPTLITFNANSTQVLSVGSTDQISENVLAGSTPATIIINGGAQPTATTVPTGSELPTTPPGADTPTVEPTLDTGATQPPTNTDTPTPDLNQPTAAPGAPVCSSLAADVLSGAAPLAVNFTASGADTDGTISKATFNFGDGQVSDVTTGGGIGSPSANVQLAHTYTTAGTFQATAILTDDSSNVSSGGCIQTITVSGGSTVLSPTPTLAATGSTAAIIGFGALAAFLMIGGALLFFAL